MRRIGRMMGLCSTLALTFAMPALAQPLTVQLREQPPESLPAVDDADYQWIDDADALLDAIGDSPPDFTFAYDRNDIWGWRTGTGHEIYGEPLGGGAIRYYYFEPGSREPFLVQDENFAFGYRSGGRLIVVYDRDGRLLSRSEGDREASLADWLYRRARAIHASAQNDRGWEPVDAGYWAEQVPIIVDLRLRWSSGRDRHPGWRRWHGRTGAAKWRAPLAGERQRRWSDGDRFRRWQRDGFRGTPPRFGVGGPRPAPGVRPPRPGWTPGTPRPPRSDGTRPWRPDGTPGGARPGRPGDRPGWVRPRPPVAGTPPAADAPIGDSPGIDPPRRPERPDRPGWSRPRPPGSDTTPGIRPPRMERPPRAEPTPQGAEPPVIPDRPRWRPDRGSRPAGADSPRPRPERPNFARPPVERPQPSQPPAERPRFTPPPAPPPSAYVPPPPPPPSPPRPVPPSGPRVVDRPIDQPQ